MFLCEMGPRVERGLNGRKSKDTQWRYFLAAISLLLPLSLNDRARESTVSLKKACPRLRELSSGQDAVTRNLGPVFNIDSQRAPSERVSRP